MQTVTIHVTTKPGFKYRPRAGLMWPAGKHAIHVVDAPKKPERDKDGELVFPVEVSAAQFAEMKADAPWIVVESGAPAEDVGALKAQIAAMTAEIAQLTAHLESLTKPKGK